MEKNEELKFVAEIGILKTIPDFLKEPPKEGRLKRIFTEIDFILNKILQKKVRKNPNYYKDNVKGLAYYLDKFGHEAKWIGEETHVASVISFCLVFLEQSQEKYPEKLFTLLNELIDYYERVGHIKFEDFKIAEDFAEVWQNIPAYKENNNVFLRS